MAYLGKRLVGVLNESKAVDTMTGDGSDTTMTLSRTPGSVNNVEVYMDGVFQTPGVEYTLSGNTVSFSSAPENGTMIIALMGNDSSIIEPNDASISGTKIAGAVVTDAKIGGMAANKLSGALPAVDGSAMTNMPSAVTKSASDPAIDSNPAGGVGTIWANTTSGEMYVLTDATTDENVWFNVGAGTGDVAPYSFQGTISGYTSGGSSNSNIIDKFSFATDGNATDVGDLTVGRYGPAGQSSSTHGYASGGSTSTYFNTIDKFSFTADGNATDVGDLTVARARTAGQSSSTHGYNSGGNTPTVVNTIDKFSFTTDGNATDVGDITVARKHVAGQSSSTHGYSSGGSPNSNVIDKFTFASDANATDVGNLTVAKYSPAGQSSTTHGYNSGGFPICGDSNVIDKFTFASDANATDVGNLTVSRKAPAGQSSTTHGYSSGGVVTPTPTNIIDKFSFTTDGNATDVGDLTVAKGAGAGQQY
mgnify:CR=1 FL=1